MDKGLINEEYPLSKLLREYFAYCTVGCINVVVFWLLYDWMYGMVLLPVGRHLALGP